VKVQRKTSKNSPKHSHFGIYGLSIEGFFKKKLFGMSFPWQTKKTSRKNKEVQSLL
jgi:hypothetical protein